MSAPLEQQVTLPDGQKFVLPTGLFINNEFVKSKGQHTLESINPATGEINGTVYAAEAEDVDVAVKAAKDAYKSWKKVTGVDRGLLLNKLADKMVEQIGRAHV